MKNATYADASSARNLYHEQIQLQNHAPFKRFAKAPAPPPLHTQAEGLAAEQEDGLTTLQSEQ
jgi:hypothetical protein